MELSRDEKRELRKLLLFAIAPSRMIGMGFHPTGQEFLVAMKVLNQLAEDVDSETGCKAQA